MPVKEKEDAENLPGSVGSVIRGQGAVPHLRPGGRARHSTHMLCLFNARCIVCISLWAISHKCLTPDRTFRDGPTGSLLEDDDLFPLQSLQDFGGNQIHVGAVLDKV